MANTLGFPTADPYTLCDEDGEGAITMQRRHGSVRIAVNNAGGTEVVYLSRQNVALLAEWATVAWQDCGNFAELDAPPDDDDEPDDETGERDDDELAGDPGWLARIQTARGRLALLNGTSS